VLFRSLDKKADDFCIYLDNNVRRISSITSEIPVNQKPRVCFISSRSLNFYKHDVLVQTWIEMGGGINVAAEGGIENAFSDLSIEDVEKWGPDIIIVSSAAQSPIEIKQKILQDPKWSDIKAVKHGKVYISPKGVYTWDFHSTETALQILWIAKTLHPDKFKDLDMAKEVKYFYSKFYCYDLTDDEVNRILNSLPPCD
jgi:iron complex transport system substrate-binding protein